MSKIKIAINGFGRIGRTAFQIALQNKNLEVVAINDLTKTDILAHLLKYDSVYGIYKYKVNSGNGFIEVNGQKVPVFASVEPSNLPWSKFKVDVVLECTGFFTNYEGAKQHLKAGAKKVIISAPTKSPEIRTFVLGGNEEKYNAKKDKIISNASCTTNCLVPVVKVLHKYFEIKKALMTTIHSYTSTQRLVDAPHKDFRRARGATLSMIPTTTGAAIAATKVLPELEGKIDGMAIRVPTPTVSLVDLTAEVKKHVTKEKVNNAFIKAAKKELKNILGVSDEPLVSIDYKKNPYSAIVDLDLTMVEGDNLVKVIAWYDNEWGYSCRLVDMAEYIGKE